MARGRDVIFSNGKIIVRDELKNGSHEGNKLDLKGAAFGCTIGKGKDAELKIFDGVKEVKEFLADEKYKDVDDFEITKTIKRKTLIKILEKE